MSSRIGEKPSKTPALVATAFPPLNPAKTGKVCPNTAKRPKTIGEIPWIPKKVGRRTASVPFKKSIAKTMIPAFFPKIRKVLVVPVLPDPCSRKLILKKTFPIHNPEGMEPNRYAKIKTLISFIILSLYQKAIDRKSNFWSSSVTSEESVQPAFFTEI